MPYHWTRFSSLVNRNRTGTELYTDDLKLFCDIFFQRSDNDRASSKVECGSYPMQYECCAKRYCAIEQPCMYSDVNSMVYSTQLTPIPIHIFNSFVGGLNWAPWSGPAAMAAVTFDAFILRKCALTRDELWIRQKKSSQSKTVSTFFIRQSLFVKKCGVRDVGLLL